MNPLEDLRGAAQIGLDIYNFMLSVRRDVDEVLLDNLGETTPKRLPLSDFLRTGFSLTQIVLDRQYALEEDLLDRLQQFIAGLSTTSTTSNLRTRVTSWRPALPNDGSLQATLRLDNTAHVFPLTLRNQQDIPQIIMLKATSLRKVEGDLELTNWISFEPGKAQIKSREVLTIYATISLKAGDLPPGDYRSEILIGGTDPRRLPALLTILAAEASDNDEAESPLEAGILADDEETSLDQQYPSPEVDSSEIEGAALPPLQAPDTTETVDEDDA